MSSACYISTTIDYSIAQIDILWNLFSKTILRWSQYLCQERRNVEARQMVGADLRFHRVFKDAICPPGFTSPETIRHFEAMTHGCVVISSPLPPNRFYKGSTIIQLSNWNELHAVVKKLLGNKNTVEELFRKTSIWWKSQCSPKALAKEMSSIL